MVLRGATLGNYKQLHLIKTEELYNYNRRKMRSVITHSKTI